ncbi:NADH:flavin oxidoreductase [Paenibacillus glycanilyticus]|uniref:NADH:flavin oxidoreductase n=1 Tax=Paenibacillus glycanilyticus TaxID=126569 RepID=UPI00203F2FFC|nr:NADH:flavin oxidoreductase [Paenibacillus glycanilyticus]MCM3629113.1 NADH:flavin oxidoreductase [Paenibacillus glycanilyticus]
MSNTNPKVQALFKPFTVNKLQLANRIVMAPMTRNFSPDGVPGKDVAAYYKRRAENGVGLIITEGTLIDHPSAGGSHNVPHFYGESSLEGWSEVVKAVHEASGRIFPQIWHVGMERNPEHFPNSNAKPVGPSGYSAPGVKNGEPLSISEIEELIEAYGIAAGEAKRIGFDGVEIHGAHGYLIDQFLWGETNKRTDKYGGNLVERTRFAVEVIEACRRAVGPDFPIAFRLSQWKTTDFAAKLVRTPEELAAMLEPLTKAGVDIYHCSTRRFWEPEFEGSDLNLAGWTKKLTGKPAITVGSVGLDSEFLKLFTEGAGASVVKLDNLLERLEEDEFDLVAIGRSLLADPAWAVKVREGREDEMIAFTKEVLEKLI